ncbi:TetR/AcrR family transcriptional regulator [Nocardiopsis aegyptia]|uniref:AcrR family transcriptional regulator n=1 Tax=Nocardiopsis aegyptia TaxID=220378 RepID=A0A7Z0EQC8_9ACTN|nr:TetR/AcrR family transcriptional regulator [Nocardiopsis aegyptia]NYJ35796.1 AcrR family transcriptional regulator [Nocardiopsis aegyptia]
MSGPDEGAPARGADGRAPANGPTGARRRAVAPDKRTRQPTEVRRRLILEAAVPLVIERGASRVGLRDIARAAGVSVGTVTYHFGGVREILSEAVSIEIDSYYRPLGERMLAAATAAEGLTTLIEGVFSAETDRHWRLWFDNWAADASLEPDSRQHRRYEEWSDRVAELIARGRDAGEFRCPDVAETTTRFNALVDGLALRRLRGAPPLSIEQARAHLRRFLAAELDLESSPA